MSSPKDFTLEQDAYIVMAHYRAHFRNTNNTWTYSEPFCFSQFMEAFPDVNVNYVAFCTYKREVIDRFEMENCICKSKSNGKPANKPLQGSSTSRQKVADEVSNLAVPKNAFQNIREKCEKLNQEVSDEDSTTSSNSDLCEEQKKLENMMREIISYPMVTKVTPGEGSRKRKVPDVSDEEGSRKTPSTSGNEKRKSVVKVISGVKTESKTAMKLREQKLRLRKLWEQRILHQKPEFRNIYKPRLRSWTDLCRSHSNPFLSNTTNSRRSESSDSDGLEELPFPTDLPLPEPDSPPPEEFSLCPLTGKVLGVDYPEPEIEPEPEETTSNVKTLEPEEGTSSMVRLVPIDKLKKLPSEMSSGDMPKTTGIIIQDVESPKIINEHVISKIDPVTNKTYLEGLQKSLAKPPVNDQFKRKITVKPFEMRIEDDTSEKLSFPNNLRIQDQKSLSSRKAIKKDNPSKELMKINGINKMVKVVKLLPALKSAETKNSDVTILNKAFPPPLKFINKTPPNCTRSMVLIRKFKPGMKPTGGRVLLKNSVPESSAIVKKPPFVPEFVDSGNIVKEEPTEIFEPII